LKSPIRRPRGPPSFFSSAPAHRHAQPAGNQRQGRGPQRAILDQCDLKSASTIWPTAEKCWKRAIFVCNRALTQHKKIAKFRGQKFVDDSPTARGNVTLVLLGKAMSNIIDLFHSTAFDPDTVKQLCEAYDKARASLHDNGQPDVVNEVIARRIIALAKQGERDPDKLCAGALVGLGDRAANG